MDIAPRHFLALVVDLEEDWLRRVKGTVSMVGDNKTTSVANLLGGFENFLGRVYIPSPGVIRDALWIWSSAGSFGSVTSWTPVRQLLLHDQFDATRESTRYTVSLPSKYAAPGYSVNESIYTLPMVYLHVLSIRSQRKSQKHPGMTKWQNVWHHTLVRLHKPRSFIRVTGTQPPCWNPPQP